MADSVGDEIQAALNKIATTTDLSLNMRKDLQKTIHQNVSNLRNLFTELMDLMEEKTRLIIHNENESNKVKAELAACRQGVAKARTETSTAQEEEPPGCGGRQVLPSHARNPKLYSEVLTKSTDRKHRLSLRSKTNQPPDIIEKILKSKVNSTEINVGINSLRQLRDGRLLIETSSKKKKKKLGEEIKAKCEEIDVNIQKLRNPRLVLLNIPEDITLDNVEETLIRQNPESDIKVGDIKAKFCYTTKRETRNMVLEVDPSTRGKLLTSRIKLGWSICRIDDYIVAKRCYRCSKYNHTFRECKVEETCPLYTGGHRLKDCTANKTEYKCIKCITHNTHNHTTKKIPLTPP
jgi:hypothetical protein